MSLLAPERGPETRAWAAVARDRIVRHEVGHLAALLMFGITPTRLQVWEDPEHAIRGVVAYLDTAKRSKVERSTDRARGFFKVILAGPICEGREPPRWPLLRGESDDEENLVTLADFLSLSEHDYDQLVAETYELVTDSKFIALETVFSAVLGDRDDFDGDLVQRLLGNERIAAYVNSRTPKEESWST
jgi:hypothetical protein